MKAAKDIKSFKLSVLIFILLTLLVAFTLASPVLAYDHRLEILGGPITVKTENAQTAPTFLVMVRNNGPKIPTLIFRAVDNDGNPIVVKILDQQTDIPAYSVKPFNIEFSDLVTKKISGYLILEANQVEPAVEALTLEPFVDGLSNALPGVGQLNASRIIGWSFWVGFACILIASLIGIYLHFRSNKNKSKRLWSMRMTSLKWDFKENWASTFVAVGGILATLAGSDIMPDTPVLISKEGFQLLNILFPILIIAAPFLLSILNSLPKEPKTDQGIVITDSEGKTPLLILPFVVGSAVVSWAILGELLTQMVLLQELFAAGILILAITQTAQIVILLFALLGLYYTWRKIVQTTSIAKTPEELKKLAGSSGVIKASRDNEKPERPVYLP